MIRSLVAIALAGLLPVCGRGDAPKVVKAEAVVAKARDDYAAALTAIRADVANVIKAKADAEVKKANPDLSKLRALEAEKEAMQKSGELPKWAEADTKISDRLAKARVPLAAALLALKKAHVEAKNLDKAEEVNKELEALTKGGPKPPLKGEAPDAFQKGTVWKGPATHTSGGGFEVTLTVLERQETTFKARYVITAPRHDREVSGRIDKGIISWTVADVKVLGNEGHEGHDHKGRIDGKKVVLNYSGAAKKGGGPVSGTVTLTLQDKK
jgi:hypothetical protein